jgi:hypothetical protein
LFVDGDVAVVDVLEWAVGLDEIAVLIGPRFVRSQPRANAVAYLAWVVLGSGAEELMDVV